MSVVEELAAVRNLDMRQAAEVLADVRAGRIPPSATVARKRDGSPWLEWRVGNVTRRVALCPDVGPLRTGATVGSAAVADTLAAPRPRATPGSTSRTAPAASRPVRTVTLSAPAFAAISGHGDNFRGDLELAGGLFGFVDPDDPDALWIRNACVATEAGSSSLSSVRLDVAAIVEAEARTFQTGARWLGDWHSHPRGIGGVADPSRADLRWWRRALTATGGSHYVGLILQRRAAGDEAWLWPSISAFVMRRDGSGITCDVVAVTVERDDGTPIRPPTPTPTSTPHWRL